MAVNINWAAIPNNLKPEIRELVRAFSDIESRIIEANVKIADLTGDATEAEQERIDLQKQLWQAQEDLKAVLSRFPKNARTRGIVTEGHVHDLQSMTPGTTMILQEDNADVNTAVNTLDFTDSDATVLSSSGNEVDVNLGLYALLNGRATPQTIHGGVAANDDLTLKGTSHATAGSAFVIISNSDFQMGTAGKRFYDSGGNQRLLFQTTNPHAVIYGTLQIDSGAINEGWILFEEATSVVAPAADTVKVYAKDDGGTTKMAYVRSDSTEVLWPSPAATTTSEGIIELATTAEVTTGTDATKAVTPASLPIQIQNSKWTYAADAVGTDAYAITLAPAVTAYAIGQVFHFKAGTVNTGACTLNVNGLGAIAIKKLNDQDPANGDIEAGQIVTVVYDGTNFQMQSMTAAAAAGGAVATDVIWDAAGDLAVGTGADTAARLAIGAANYVLTSNGTTAVWDAVDLIPEELALTGVHTVTTVGSVASYGGTLNAGKTRCLMSPASALTIQGIGTTGVVTGQIMTFTNTTGAAITVNHMHASGLAKVKTPGVVDMTIAERESFVVIYDHEGDGTWSVIGKGYWATTADLADVAAAEATGTALSIPRGDHVHKLGILTTKGDVLTYSTLPARLAVGANATVLTADSAEATGMKWAVPPSVAPNWIELPHNAQGADVVFIPGFVGASYAKIGIFMPSTPSAQHSFSFFKTGSGTATGAVTVTTTGNFWTTTVAFSLTAVTDWMSVRHDTNAQDADENTTSPHPDEGLKVYAALIP